MSCHVMSCNVMYVCIYIYRAMDVTVIVNCEPFDVCGGSQGIHSSPLPGMAFAKAMLEQQPL